jgi:hypothetical protein
VAAAGCSALASLSSTHEGAVLCRDAKAHSAIATALTTFPDTPALQWLCVRVLANMFQRKVVACDVDVHLAARTVAVLSTSLPGMLGTADAAFVLRALRSFHAVLHAAAAAAPAYDDGIDAVVAAVPASTTAAVGLLADLCTCEALRRRIAATDAVFATSRAVAANSRDTALVLETCRLFGTLAVVEPPLSEAVAAAMAELATAAFGRPDVLAHPDVQFQTLHVLRNVAGIGDAHRLIVLRAGGLVAALSVIRQPWRCSAAQRLMALRVIYNLVCTNLGEPVHSFRKLNGVSVVKALTEPGATWDSASDAETAAQRAKTVLAAAELHNQEPALCPQCAQH